MNSWCGDCQFPLNSIAVHFFHISLQTYIVVILKILYQNSYCACLSLDAYFKRIDNGTHESNDWLWMKMIIYKRNYVIDLRIHYYIILMHSRIYDSCEYLKDTQV